LATPAHHDFGPVVADGVGLADGGAVEVENPVERRDPGPSADVAAQKRVALADRRRARETSDHGRVYNTYTVQQNTP